MVNQDTHQLKKKLILRNSATRLYKVGVTENPGQRAKSANIRTYYPIPQVSISLDYLWVNNYYLLTKNENNSCDLMMNKEMFNELLESVQEMDEIVKKEKEASRSFEYSEPELKSTHGNWVQIRMALT